MNLKKEETLKAFGALFKVLYSSSVILINILDNKDRVGLTYFITQTLYYHIALKESGESITE